MPSILFVCTANRFRSPLAAALFEQALQRNDVQGSWVINSAGTWAIPGQPVLPLVFEVAKRYKLNLAGHHTTRVRENLLSDFDLILVMQASHKEALQSEFPSASQRIYLLSEVVEHRAYDLPDTSNSLQGISDLSAELADLIRRGYRGICVLATYLHNARNQSGFHDG